MRYTDIQVDPPGPHRLQPVVSFTASFDTVEGRRVEARVSINPSDLHYQIVKATKNRAKRSRDGALTVKILAH